MLHEPVFPQKSPKMFELKKYNINKASINNYTFPLIRPCKTMFPYKVRSEVDSDMSKKETAF